MRRNDAAGRSTALGVGIAPLSQSDRDVVHLATLEVLERTGAYVEDGHALASCLPAFSYDGGTVAMSGEWPLTPERSVSHGL